jgi:serpin B
MKRIGIVLAGLALAVLVGCRGGQPDEPKGLDTPDAPNAPPAVEWSGDMQAVADGGNRFALDLYAKLAADEANKGKNLFFSPYSVHTALAMTTAGAKGTTRDQMVTALHLPADAAKALASGDLGRYYTSPRKDFELNVANALWGLKGFPWRADFLDLQAKRFGAGFREADFRNNPDGERDRINKWVEEQTRERIKELLVQGQITRDTTMVLANAVYFKGKWATQFDPTKTRTEKFECDDNTRVDVPMMHANPKCGYMRGDGFEVVELPYRGGELSMVVVLPSRANDLASVEKKLTPEALAGWLAALRDRAELSVSLPKFRIESRFELPKHLKALGMLDAFDRDQADFTGMASEPPGYITEVAHKAFVEVSEEGTEAAAATAVVEGDASKAVLPFYANRPFLFLIRDAKRGPILFAGRVERP